MKNQLPVTSNSPSAEPTEPVTSNSPSAEPTEPVTSNSPSAEPTEPVTSNQLPAQAKAISRAWLVAYTKPRWEKKLADQLAAKGFDVYCPTQRVKRRWSDRTKWIDQPLFSSHIFVHLEPERRDAVYFTPGFVRFLFWNKRPAVVRDEEIATLKRWLNDFDHEAISIQSLATGSRVSVSSGPLQGQEATVLEQRGTKLELYLEDLQVKVSVDLTKTELVTSY
jgi:transcription antitermination factor NusG